MSWDSSVCSFPPPVQRPPFGNAPCLGPLSCPRHQGGIPQPLWLWPVLFWSMEDPCPVWASRGTEINHRAWEINKKLASRSQSPEAEAGVELSRLFGWEVLVFCYSRLDGCPDRWMDEPVKHSEPRRNIRNHNSLTGVSVFSALVAPQAQPGPDPPLPSSNEAGDANCTVILGDQVST